MNFKERKADLEKDAKNTEDADTMEEAARHPFILGMRKQLEDYEKMVRDAIEECEIEIAKEIRKNNLKVFTADANFFFRMLEEKLGIE